MTEFDSYWFRVGVSKGSHASKEGFYCCDLFCLRQGLPMAMHVSLDPSDSASGVLRLHVQSQP